jgi:hypothetical protein
MSLTLLVSMQRETDNRSELDCILLPGMTRVDNLLTNLFILDSDTFYINYLHHLQSLLHTVLTVTTTSTNALSSLAKT